MWSLIWGLVGADFNAGVPVITLAACVKVNVACT